MIVVELAGGLGNQMFQYAFGKSIAKKNNQKLLLDLGFLNQKSDNPNFTNRDYELSVFGINPTLIQSKHSNSFKKWKKNWRSVLFQRIYPPLSRYVKEDYTSYHPSYEKLNGPVYLRGYWQNPRYFSNVLDEIREEYKFDCEFTPETIKFSNQIKEQKCSVSIHFRRGDYLRDPVNEKICSLEYYKKSLELMLEKNEKAHFFVFSDDISWVKENFPIESPHTFIDRNLPQNKNHEDLYLMSQCQNHILANSSFSWWGSFLGKNSDQLVIAPEQWDAQRKSQDLKLDNWMLI